MLLHNSAGGCWKERGRERERERERGRERERERKQASWQRSLHHHDTWGCLAAAGEHCVMQRRESRTSWKPKASRGNRSVTVKQTHRKPFVAFSNTSAGRFNHVTG